MEKKHLFWIIPATLVIGFLLGSFAVASGQAYMMEKYPVVNCIYKLDLIARVNSMNVEGNTMPFTGESQREAIQWYCAKEHVDMNASEWGIVEIR